MADLAKVWWRLHRAHMCVVLQFIRSQESSRWRRIVEIERVGTSVSECLGCSTSPDSRQHFQQSLCGSCQETTIARVDFPRSMLSLAMPWWPSYRAWKVCGAAALS